MDSWIIPPTDRTPIENLDAVENIPLLFASDSQPALSLR